MRSKKIVIIFLCSFILSGCMLQKKGAIGSAGEDMAGKTGTMRYLDFEGGFYGIVADDSEHYDPINLPEEFETDGLRVRFDGKIRDDIFGIHMWGRYIELEYINCIGQGVKNANKK